AAASPVAAEALPVEGRRTAGQVAEPAGRLQQTQSPCQQVPDDAPAGVCAGDEAAQPLLPLRVKPRLLRRGAARPPRPVPLPAPPARCRSHGRTWAARAKTPTSNAPPNHANRGLPVQRTILPMRGPFQTTSIRGRRHEGREPDDRAASPAVAGSPRQRPPATLARRAPPSGPAKAGTILAGWRAAPTTGPRQSLPPPPP